MSYTSLNCPRCHAEAVSARISGGGQMPDQMGETRYFFTAVCSKCGFPVTIIVRRVPGRLPDGPQLVAQVCKTGRDPIPNLIELVEMIPAPVAPVASLAPENVPANVASAFSEAKDSIRRGAVLSGSMALRVTLERAVRALGSGAEASLRDRIVRLISERGLPRELARWATEIELLQGKGADPDSDPMTEALMGAADFTEMFLICAFTLPARIENRRNGPGAASGTRDLPPGRGPHPALSGPGPRRIDDVARAWDDDRALQPVGRVPGPGL